MNEPYYVTNPPARTSGEFYGRQTEIAWLMDQLAQGQRVLAIYGPRHTGKSALLDQLLHRLPDSYLAVRLDAGAAKEGDTTPPLFQVANEVGRIVREQTGDSVAPPDVTSFVEAPLEAWETYAEALMAQLDRPQLALLIDNADRAPAAWLHALLETSAQIVLTAESKSQLADRLPDSASAPPSIALGNLNNEAAEALVKASLKLQIDPWAVRRTLEITSNHPYYLLLFCRELSDRHAYKSLITSPDVEETLQALLDAEMPDFLHTWESASAHEKMVLSAFGALIGIGGIATQYDIQKSCSRHGRYIPLPDVVATLERLAQRGILERLGTNSYRFTLELFRLWLSHHHQPTQVLRQRFWSLGGASARQMWAERLSRRWSLWASIGVILLVALIVALQPALRQNKREATVTFVQQSSGTPQTPVPTRFPSESELPATATPVPQPTVILPGYDMLFMSRSDPEAPWQIYAFDSHSGKRLRLTETPSNERTPRWSPDGNGILFASDRDGNREVYVMDADGSSLINLTRNQAPDWQPAWSPDGRRVAFSSYRDGDWEVYLVDADGTNLIRLTEHPESDFSPTWSPDGTRVLFVSRRHGDADLFIADLESGELTQLTYGERDEYDPAWSPDGAWIAFVTQIGTQSDLFVMRADGSEPLNLTNSSYANDFQPAWTADSAWLIFVSYTAADGDHDLFRVRRDGRELGRLTDDDMDNVAPSIRYAGR